MPFVWKLISFIFAHLQDNLLPSKPSTLPPNIFNASFHFVRSIFMSAEVSSATILTFCSASIFILTLPDAFKSISVFLHTAYTFMSFSTLVPISKSGIRASAVCAQPMNTLFASSGFISGNLPPLEMKYHPLSTMAWFTQLSVSPPFLSKITPAYLLFS